MKMESGSGSSAPTRSCLDNAKRFYENHPTVCKILAFLFVAGIIIMIILIAVSYKSVNYDEWGLLYSTTSREIKSRSAYGPGRYHVGIGNDFHTFPKHFQIIEFSYEAEKHGYGRGPVAVRTRDKYANILELSVQYSLVKDDLFQLFELYKDDYESYYVRDAIGVFNDIGPQFLAEQFFESREELEDAMRTTLQKVLADRFAKLEGLQLISIILDQKIEDQLIQNQVRNETNVLITLRNDLLVNTSHWERELQKVNANISIEEASVKEETKQMSIDMQLEIDTINKNTETAVVGVEAHTSKIATEYKQQTENLRLEIDQNVTLVAKHTEKLIAEMEAEIALGRVHFEAQKRSINTEGEANKTAILSEAEANVREAQEGMYKEHLGLLKSELSLSQEELVRYEWFAVLGEKNDAAVYLDYKKPDYTFMPTTEVTVNEAAKQPVTTTSTPPKP
eukprot:NODE_1639_length_1654_cov_103.790986_g1560_i0.p1 GENE.NODE_1639_length_1654_cov_103.790986_g1560_i0~~NODE_1639_length_1654_cov_103.790986_g1560_i0.p1  ORF type:complete len:451 (-),score=103.72 NODE_1639_length_1654_cov_103.790986_g1560_i0:240-1592(-)